MIYILYSDRIRQINFRVYTEIRYFTRKFDILYGNDTETR